MTRDRKKRTDTKSDIKIKTSIRINVTRISLQNIEIHGPL